MGRFNRYQLLFIIPGFGLAIISLYVPLNYLRKQLSWTETEARIVERTEFDNGGADIRYRLQFTDTHEAVYDFYPAVRTPSHKGKIQTMFGYIMIPPILRMLNWLTPVTI